MILVAGGTGFVGSHLVRSLVTEGHSVRILSRSAKTAPDFGQAETVSGDVTDTDSLLAAVEGCAAVVMAAQFPGHPVERRRKGFTYDAVDRAGTENLLAASVAAGAERFLYVSGAGVGAGRSEEWFVAKEAAERAVRESGLEWLILRPSWAYGPEDKALDRIARIARWSPVVPVLGWKSQRVMPVLADDIGLAVAAAFANPGTWNCTYEIGGPDVMTMKEVVETLLDVMGKRRLLVPAPKPLMKIAAWPISLLPNGFLSPRAVDFATGDAVVDNSGVVEQLDLKPRRLDEGLRTYMAS